eukprot:2906300-Lingulodinium_polyedra.AAC.1
MVGRWSGDGRAMAGRRPGDRRAMLFGKGRPLHSLSDHRSNPSLKVSPARDDGPSVGGMYIKES